MPSTFWIRNELVSFTFLLEKQRKKFRSCIVWWMIFVLSMCHKMVSCCTRIRIWFTGEFSARLKWYVAVVSVFRYTAGRTYFYTDNGFLHSCSFAHCITKPKKVIMNWPITFDLSHFCRSYQKFVEGLNTINWLLICHQIIGYLRPKVATRNSIWLRYQSLKQLAEFLMPSTKRCELQFCP